MARQTSSEQFEQEVQDLNTYLKERFMKMKDVTDKILSFIRSGGSEKRHRSMSDRNKDPRITAMILENLINSFEKKMVDVTLSMKNIVKLKELKINVSKTIDELVGKFLEKKTKTSD